MGESIAHFGMQKIINDYRCDMPQWMAEEFRPMNAQSIPASNFLISPSPSNYHSHGTFQIYDPALPQSPPPGYQNTMTVSATPMNHIHTSYPPSQPTVPHPISPTTTLVHPNPITTSIHTSQFTPHPNHQHPHHIYQQHTQLENPYYSEPVYGINPNQNPQYMSIPFQNTNTQPSIFYHQHTGPEYPYQPEPYMTTNPNHAHIPYQTSITIMDIKERDQIRMMVEQKLGLFFDPIDWCVHFDEIMGMLLERYPELRDNLSSPSPLPLSTTPLVFDEMPEKTVETLWYQTPPPTTTTMLQTSPHTVTTIPQTPHDLQTPHKTNQSPLLINTMETPPQASSKSKPPPIGSLPTPKLPKPPNELEFPDFIDPITDKEEKRCWKEREVLQGEEHEFEHDRTESQYGSTTVSSPNTSLLCAPPILGEPPPIPLFIFTKPLQILHAYKLFDIMPDPIVVQPDALVQAFSSHNPHHYCFPLNYVFMHLSYDWAKISSRLVCIYVSGESESVGNIFNCYVLGCKLHYDVLDSSKEILFEPHKFFESLPNVGKEGTPDSCKDILKFYMCLGFIHSAKVVNFQIRALPPEIIGTSALASLAADGKCGMEIVIAEGNWVTCQSCKSPGVQEQDAIVLKLNSGKCSDNLLKKLKVGHSEDAQINETEQLGFLGGEKSYGVMAEVQLNPKNFKKLLSMTLSRYIITSIVANLAANEKFGMEVTMFDCIHDWVMLAQSCKSQRVASRALVDSTLTMAQGPGSLKAMMKLIQLASWSWWIILKASFFKLQLLEVSMVHQASSVSMINKKRGMLKKKR